MDLCEIEYLFQDELKEKDHRCSNLVVYDSQDEIGEKLSSALNAEDFDEVDNILSEHFGIKDDDVAFYQDWNELPPEDGRNAASLILELQSGMDILVYDLTYVEGV